MMTWADDETGMLVITGKGKAPKPAKKPKPPKAEKQAARAPDQRPLPGVPPVGLPIVRPTPPRDVATGARTSMNPAMRSTSKVKQASGVGRFVGILLVVIVIAGGGFAAGALTELGSEAENMVLGPTPPPRPAADPRVKGLESELSRLQAELAAERTAAAEARAAAARTSGDDANVVMGDGGDNRRDRKDRKAKRSHHRRHKDSRVDL